MNAPLPVPRPRLPFRAWGALLLPAGLLAGILANSIQAAGWVGNSLPLLLSLLAGLAAGLALARTRWRWHTALGYHAALAGGTLLLLVARVPPLDQLSLGAADFFFLMNGRLSGLLERMAGWAGAFFSGGSIQDPDAFTFLVGGVLWSAGAWLGWCLLRRGRALPGLIPLGFLLALNVYLNQEAATTMLGFLTLGVVLVAMTDWLREQQRWLDKGVDYSEDLGFTWTGSVAGLSLLIALLMWASSLLGTPQGWEALSRILRSAEQEVGEPAGRIFAGASTPEATDGSVAIKRPDLANIGEPINRDQGVVMWVNVSDPIPLPANVAGQGYTSPPGHYWRSAIYGMYTGRGWDAAPTAGVITELPPSTGAGGEARPGQIPQGDPMAAPGRYLLVQYYRIVAKHDALLFAVGEPVIAPEGVTLRAVAGGSAQLEGSLSSYQVSSWATRVSAEELQAAGEEYPAEVRETYLQLPEGLPERVRQMAARITRGAATPYEKALRIEAYLRANYQYDPYVSTPPEGRDAVDYFLFDAPGGFCTYYASAMAVMLRAEGVPARVASGYLMGEYDRMEGAYRVVGAASHTWVEVYFPGYGWVEFEPTSAFPRLSYPGEEKVTAEQSPAERVPPLDEFPGLKVALWTAGILAGLSVLWLGLRRLGVPGPQELWARYQASRAAVPLSRGLYAQMRRGMARCGVAALPGDTPYEFLGRVEETLRVSKTLRVLEAIRLVTEAYVQAQYSPRAPAPALVRSARRAWAKTRWARLKCMLRGGKMRG